MKKTVAIIFFSLFTGSLSAQKTYPLYEYTELTDTKPHHSDTIWRKQVKSPRLAWGSTDIRYPQQNIPAETFGTKTRLKGWKGERVNAQAVLWSAEELQESTLSLSPLVCGKDTLPTDAVSLHFVRYVMTDELNKDGKGGCGHRPDKTEWDSSLVADPLDIVKARDVRACSVQPVWVNVWIPSTAKAGKYKGTLTVAGKNFAPLQLALEIEVLNRTLPAPRTWRFHLDLWQNPYAVARYYQVPLWSDEHFEAMRPIMQKLADAGQKVVTATIMHRPWDGQTQDPFYSMVNKTKRIDGSWSYDYTVFDKWVGFMTEEIGIDRQINCYTMIPWSLQFDYYDEATQTVQFVSAKPGEQAYEQYWSGFLSDFARHLKEKGWFEKTTISMDERDADAMQEALKVIQKADAGFKVSLAGNYHEELEPDLYDYCLAFGHNFPRPVKERRMQAGKKSTVYTCCTEAMPNVFTFSPPAEANWLGWHVAAGGYDGYLRWAYNSWTEDPLRDSRFRSWAAGDCYLVYPGMRSSIRMERLIEGIQDCEKIWILQQTLTGRKQQEKLQQTVEMFTPEGLTREEITPMVNRAREILNSL
ncbi:MAG: DUF4091 domain-containing protein [Coprobacter sp.]|nr:DUF4091 domain-containing protein [Coprobacter sp.]